MPARDTPPSTPTGGRTAPAVRALDAVILTGGALWPAVYSWGPVAVPATAFAVSWRGLGAALGLAVLARHAIQVRPSVVAPVITWARRQWRREGTRRAVGIAALSRLAVLAVGLIATLAIGIPSDAYAVADSPVWNLQWRWDAAWYATIARHGYSWDPALDIQQNVAFFPAFPVLMRLAGDLVTIPAYVAGDPELFGTTGDARLLAGGTVVSLLAFLAAMPMLYRLARLDVGEREARWTVAFACSLPFGVFFGAAYTESLFLAGLVGAFLAFRRGQYTASALWGVLLGLTRPNGFLVAGALALLAWERRRESERRQAGPGRMVAVVAPAAGLVLQSAYLWSRFGDPFAWSAAQAAWGRTAGLTTLVGHRWAAVQEAGLLGYLQAQPYEVANTAMLVAALLLAWRVRKVAWSYAALVLLLLAPAVAVDLPALGRMTAPLFPIALALAIAVPVRARAPVAVGSMALQVVAAALFYTWRPLY